MTNFKLSTAAAAIFAASALPAFAQDATVTATGIEIPEGTVIPENHILLQFTDMMDQGFFVVSFDDAAEICGITEAEFALIAEDPTTGVIYCEELQVVEARNAFIEEGRITPLADFEDADDDDDDGNFADDAEETAVDEAIDEANDGDNLEDALEDDDVEAPANDDEGGEDSDSAEGEDVTQ